MRLGTFLSLLLLPTAFAFADKPVTITIVHTNDIHAHVEPVSISKKLYGGYTRQATLIKQIRQKDPNVILLNAGDTFQGTMYFNIYEGLADLAYMNSIGFQAMTLGNHEFDRGPEVTSAFVRLATFPIVSANLDVSNEPALKGLIKPYAIVGSGDAKIGVVGAITPEMPGISSPGPNVKLTDLVQSVQAAVDDLEKQGIDRIVLLSHVGYDEDQALVAKTHGIDLVVGGHSHTPLGTPDLPGWPKPAGPYPTKVKDAEGREVLVVQSWEWGKALGRIKLAFDAKGHVSKVVEAAPIVVDESVPEDLATASLIAAVQKPIAATMNAVVGSTPVAIPNGARGMARIVADAMLEATTKYGAVAAFVNGGGVRSGIDAGKITYGAANSVQPFRNILVVLDVTGDELRRSLEIGAGAGGMLLPSKGTSYRVDRSKPEGSRVSDVILGGQPIEPGKTYRIALLNYISNGGDQHTVLRDAKGERTDTGIVDLDALVAYLKAHNPVEIPTDPRVVD